MRPPPVDLAAFAIEHAPDVFAVLSPDWRLVWLGGATAKLGSALGDAVGRPLLDYVHPDDVEQALAALVEASASTGFHKATVVRMKRDDDRLVRLRVTATTVSCDDGDWLVLCGRGEDDDAALEGRRRALTTAVAQVAETCAGMRWYEFSNAIPQSLAHVAEIVGADRIELVTAVELTDADPADPLMPDAAITLAWSQAADDELPGTPTRFLTDRRRLRTVPCVRHVPGDGRPCVVEVGYDGAQGDWGAVRLHFAADILRWEDANADYLRVLGSVLASTAHRCREEERSHHLATRDALTGLLNRRGLVREVGAWTSLDAVDPLSVVFVDLNGFKSVNDRLGHRTGDEVLRAAADALRQTVRGDDLVARLGGDEFVVVVPSIKGLTTIGDRIRAAVDSLADRWSGISAAVGVSVGQAGDDVDDLIDRADAAMYEDKRAAADGRIVTASS